MFSGKLCSLATITLSSILVVDLCYPYVTMLVSRSHYVYHAAIYSLIPTSYHLMFVYLLALRILVHARSVAASQSFLMYHLLSMIGGSLYLKLMLMIVGYN